MDYLQVLLELSKTVENTKAAYSKAVTGDSRLVTRKGSRKQIAEHCKPNRRSRKPVLREIVMQEKWRRGNGDVGVEKVSGLKA